MVLTSHKYFLDIFGINSVGIRRRRVVAMFTGIRIPELKLSKLKTRYINKMKYNLSGCSICVQCAALKVYLI